METRVLHEITPLAESDFMYVADRHKTEFNYPIHNHDVCELNFVENAAGCRRVVGDSSEVIGDYDLVLITGPELEHVWEQHECHSDDIHEITVQFNLDFNNESGPFGTNPMASIRKLCQRAQRGVANCSPSSMSSRRAMAPTSWRRVPSQRSAWRATAVGC